MIIEADVVLAANRDEAVGLILNEMFDIVICDLRLPPRAGTAETDTAYGLDVHHTLRQEAPGTPSLFFTGVDDRVSIRDAHQASGTHDIFGSNDDYPLVSLLFKDEMRACLLVIKEVAEHISALDAIDISGTSSSTLVPSNRRVLQIFARRNGGRRIVVERKDTGLSGVDALVALVENSSNQITARVFMKIGPTKDILHEREVFVRHVPQLLEGHCFAPLVDTVEAGAGSQAGIIFSIAEGYNDDLFSILGNETTALHCIAAIQDIVKRWAALNRVEECTIRELLPSSVNLDALREQFGKDSPVCQPEFWDSSRSVRLARQHGDLHGQNILTGGPSTAYLIDFAATGDFPACLDALTLELSLVFHKHSPIKDSGWPTVEQAREWQDLDTYLVDCPCPSVVTALREWARREAGSPDEMEFVALVHILRQAKYSDTRKDLIDAMAKGLIACLGL